MILFVAPPFAGHLDRMIPLAEAARARGHSCRFVTGHRRVPDLAKAGFAADAPDSLPDGALEAIAEGYGRIHGHPLRALAQLRDNMRLIPDLTDDLVRIGQRHSVRAIVADSIALMAGPAARRLEVPWITTIATPLALESRDGPPSYLGGLAPRADLLGQMRDAAGRRLQRAAKTIAFRMVGRPARAMLPGLYRPDGSEAIYSPHAILGFGMTELEFPRSWPAVFEMIGPVHGPRRPAAPLDLPHDRKRVLATLGTHLPWARARWEADLWALARARPDVHFTVTRGGQGGTQMAPPPNVLAVPYAEYATEVARHDAIIHHGGSGIAYAAIEAGKPSLVVPQDFDQFDYAARIAHHGLGLWVKRLAGAQAALDRVLDEAWPQIRPFTEAAQRYDPGGRFLATLARLGV